jgi:hypothetical protein
MFLCMHQTTSMAAGFTAGSLETTRPGIRCVEVIRRWSKKFTKHEVSRPQAPRFDLGLRAFSSGRSARPGGPCGARRAIEDLKRIAALVAEWASTAWCARVGQPKVYK